MKSKMVIVWGQDDLLSWAMKYFLTSRKDWNVVSLASERGIDFLIHEVETLNPDVVIVYQIKCTNNVRLLMQLLYARPELTLLTVSPQENSIEVYSKKQIFIQEVSDLISVVEGEQNFVH